jgi:hypothetical protein
VSLSYVGRDLDAFIHFRELLSSRTRPLYSRLPFDSFREVLRCGIFLALLAVLLIGPASGASGAHRRAVNPYFVTINVMFLYPPEALSHATAEQLHSYCVAKVDSANQIIRNSGKGTTAQFRLAWDQVSDEAAPSDRSELLWMQQSKYVGTLRYVHQADLVGYLPVHQIPGEQPDLAYCPNTRAEFTPDMGSSSPCCRSGLTVRRRRKPSRPSTRCSTPKA